MAVQYRLVLRKNMKKDPPAGEENLYYAQAKSTGTCTFDDLCEQIADSSTASSGDVKVVLDRLNKYMGKALLRGEIVQMGELGNFQLSVCSKGAATADGFSQSLIRKSNLLFRPGAILRNIVSSASYERLTEAKCDKPHVGDEPENPEL